MNVDAQKPTFKPLHAFLPDLKVSRDKLHKWSRIAVLGGGAPRKFNPPLMMALFPVRVCQVHAMEEEGDPMSQLAFLHKMLTIVKGGDALTEVDAWNILHHGIVPTGDGKFCTVFTRFSLIPLTPPQATQISAPISSSCPLFS